MAVMAGLSAEYIMFTRDYKQMLLPSRRILFSITKSVQKSFPEQLHKSFFFS